jgi:hypothetical protein
MAFTEIDLERQSQDGTLVKGKLKADFLEGGNLNLTDGNNDATITGLAAGVNPTDAVNKAQLDALTIEGGMTYRGIIDASDATGAALDGASKGDFFYVSVGGTLDGKAFSVTDHLVVNADITDFDVDGAGKIDKVDNTESLDLLRDSDIVDDLTTGGSANVLSAEQGKVLKGLVDDLQTEVDDTQTGAGLAADGSYVQPSGSNYIDASTSLASADALLDAQIKVNADAIAAIPVAPSEVYSEKPAITVGNAVLAPLANIPVLAGTARVYWNGLRAEEGAGNDYTIDEITGVITMGSNMKVKDKIIVDYKY